MSLSQGYRLALFLLPLAALTAGAFPYSAGDAALASQIWMAGTLPVLAGLAASIIISLAQGRFGLDIIALFSMAGSLMLGQELAGIVVALMYAGGNLLEAYAEHRARRDMRALLERVPRHAHRQTVAGDFETVPLADIAPGDRLLVKGGEAVPVDGSLASPAGVLDEVALTGEPIPVTYAAGAALMSGATNAGGPFLLTATASAAESTYAQIVRLVTAAQESRAPVARLADRYALYFLALTALIAGAAWFITGEALRVLAVLVIATPCPLILGVPVAVVSGMSACARRGVLVKSGGVLEGLAEAHTLLFDKTGTLTEGRARIIRIISFEGMPEDRIIALAAGLDQMSQHLVAATIVAEARARGLALAQPDAVREDHGHGIAGHVAGREVAVGSLDYVLKETGQDDAPESPAALSRNEDGALSVYVAVDGRMVGVITLSDEIRAEAADALALARAAGIRRFVMVTGDRKDVAEMIGGQLGVDEVHAALSPGGKVEVVRTEQARAPSVMVGDGTNDAPALAAASVGIAMGARGSAASSDAAGAVVMIDSIDRVAEALHIARHTRAVALQSVMIGMALSLAGMIAAAAGYLTPVQGALLQEAIDAAAVLNALRALGTPRIG